MALSSNSTDVTSSFAYLFITFIIHKSPVHVLYKISSLAFCMLMSCLLFFRSSLPFIIFRRHVIFSYIDVTRKRFLMSFLLFFFAMR